MKRRYFYKKGGNILKIRIIKNNLRGENYFHHSRFSEKDMDKAVKFLGTIQECKESPLVSLKELSKHLGVEDIFVKDEGNRCILKSFKILGATYAISEIICDELGISIEGETFNSLKERCREWTGRKIVFTTCSDGNHGRAVAWASSQLGFKSVIYFNKGTDPDRARAIEVLGGEAIITELNYDDTVRYANEMAKKNSWTIVQDTSWEGYTDIPVNIMRGYSKMIHEALAELSSKEEHPTHIFLQAGVGAMAGGGTACVVNHYRSLEHKPKIIIVEPNNAACYFKSASANDGHIHIVDGEMESLMVGLACGEPVKEGWEVIKNNADYFLKCHDYFTVKGMRVASCPIEGDEKIVSGESGAVSLGIVYELLDNVEFSAEKEQLGLDRNSRILVFSTEGDTAPKKYREIIWNY